MVCLDLPKMQVWKIIFFFHTNRPKKIFSRLENDQIFSILFKTPQEPCIFVETAKQLS